MTNIRKQMASHPSRTRLRGELADARAAQKAREEPFESKRQTAQALVARREAQASERTKTLWKWVGVLGATAVLGIAAGPRVARWIAPTATGQTPTELDLSRMPQAQFRFRSGQGIDDAIEAVDGSKNIFSNGPELAAVEGYVRDQIPNGTPQPGETVNVPEVPQNGN